MTGVKRRILKVIPHMLLYSWIFYILPLIFMISDNYKLVIMAGVVQLFYINPVCCIILGAFFGVNNGFKVYYLAIAPLLFIPAMPLIYDMYDYVYIVFYLITALIGLTIGWLFRFYNSRATVEVKRRSKSPSVTRVLS